MKIRFVLFFTLTAFFSEYIFSQTTVEKNLKQHISYLADDKLEGRLAGSKGEQSAYEYIETQFRNIGLLPAGEAAEYLQPFNFFAGKEAGKQNFVNISNRIYQVPDVYPLALSGNGIVTSNVMDIGYGISAPQIEYDDYANKSVSGKIVLIKLSSPEGFSPHTKFYDYADERTKVKTAEDKGAAAVIFYNEDSLYAIPQISYKEKITAEKIPVLYVTHQIAEVLKNYEQQIIVSAQLNPINKTAYNVLGYIDNKSENTIVLGAHYDHIGNNELGGSLYRGDPAIHNGADDNASGVAFMIELAKWIKASAGKNNNYLFIAFSGEEEGLLGSNYFVNSGLMKNFTFNYMLNFDMLGRMDSVNNLIIYGVGTSPEWKGIDSIPANNLKIKKTESGMGPSDQTSFYLKNIPVLFFFTGTHSDYHKPGDDENKINYSGMQQVLNYVEALLDKTDKAGKISFTKTKDDSNEDIPKFTVTLGVVPDYAFNGSGMRIDGVTDGKTASNAGIISGDIVIKLGSYTVVDMMSYMQALSKFKKGDATTVTIMRNNSAIQIPIQF